METRELPKRNTSTILNLAGLIIVLSGVMYASPIIKPLLLAVFVTIVFAQPLAWLVRKKVPQGLAILIVMLGGVLVFFGIGQVISSSFSQFSNDASKYAARLSEIASSLIQWFSDLGMDLSSEKIKGMLGAEKILGVTTNMAGEIGSLMGNMAIVVFIVVFILLELNSFAVKTIALVDTPAVSLQHLSRIGNSIRHYLAIKTYISLMTGFLIWIGLLVIGVDYAILWALIAFLLNFIPNIGSFIAMVPAFLFALVQLGLGASVWTLVVFMLVNTIAGSVVEPRVMGKGLGLSTLVVFISLIFWGFLLGTVGMFLSVPLTMTAKIMLEQRENTKWIAILLGTQKEAEVIIERRKYTEADKFAAVEDELNEYGGRD
ncbi:MAG: AI-2E family transporter [Chlorobi bacterium]|nr:AI-2E family transporter [Chlorobiota bacterium]